MTPKCLVQDFLSDTVRNIRVDVDCLQACVWIFINFLELLHRSGSSAPLQQVPGAFSPLQIGFLWSIILLSLIGRCVLICIVLLLVSIVFLNFFSSFGTLLIFILSLIFLLITINTLILLVFFDPLIDNINFRLLILSKNHILKNDE